MKFRDPENDIAQMLSHKISKLLLVLTVYSAIHLPDATLVISFIYLVKRLPTLSLPIQFLVDPHISQMKFTVRHMPLSMFTKHIGPAP